MSKFTDGQAVLVTAKNGRKAVLKMFIYNGIESVTGPMMVMHPLFGPTGSYPAHGGQVVSIEPVPEDGDAQPDEAQQPMLGGIL